MSLVVILCGGRGTRLQERAPRLPKPLVEIGGKPIVWHVIQIYAAQRFSRFLLATGYRGEAIAEFTRNASWPDGVEVECVDTGLDTPTGGRVHRLRDRLAQAPFCLTYADGLADIDLAAELEGHRAQGALATMAVVRPELPFGITEIAPDGRITGFQEKPRSEHWINGGFLYLEPAALSYVDETSVLERQPLERLAADGGLRAHRHEGFWACMDTYKDAIRLNDLWSVNPPWKL